MQISIHPPLYINKIGKRGKNQDSIYPSCDSANAENRVFLVCDGVGGAASGEIASRVSADTIGHFFENRTATIETIEQAVDAAQKTIDRHLEIDPLSKGMGTTLTFLQFHAEGATVAHIGDSRVYQIRNGQIVFCTDDHSLVNEMRKQGMDNLENVQSNIITRAIQGQSVRAVKADVECITDIAEGDYFLLCSDGIWGVYDDAELVEIINNSNTREEKLAEIEAHCAIHSHDNYSAYLIQIASVGDKKTSIEPIDNQSDTDEEETESARQNILIEETQKPRKAAWVIPLIIIVVFAAIIWALLNS
jgi:PPM family protein phosphatase